MARGCHKALSILRAYSRALSHQLRSPLSVIVSDLSSPSGSLDASVQMRALAKCEQIVSILQDSTPGVVAPHAVSEQLSVVVQREFAPHTITQSDSSVLVDGRFVTPALGLLSAELLRLSFGFSVELSESVLRISLKRDCSSENCSRGTFSELFSDSFGIDSVTFPLVDALLIASGAVVLADGASGKWVVEVEFGDTGGERSDITD